MSSTPSNPPSPATGADTPAPVTDASPRPTESSMQSILDGLAQLATRVSRDRAVHTYSTNVLLDAHVVGEGFVETRKAASEEAVDDEEEMEAETHVLVGDDRTGDVRIRISGDAAYIEDGGEEEEEEEEEEETNEEEEALFTRDNIISWLNSLGGHIERLHRTPVAGTPIHCPHLAIEPKIYQYSALAKIEHNRETPLKAILIGDPPGLGKTLPAMMATVRAISTARRFSIVVVPPSCAEQWKTEFEIFFLLDTVRVFALRDPNTPPLELLKYDVIIVSYAFVMSQYRRMLKYLDAIAEFKKKGSSKHLSERPNLSIFSEVFQAQEGVKSPYLVLDEVTAIKNTRSLTFAAVRELRETADTCVMLTGSPLDNTWMDTYSYLQLVLGHDIRSRRTMLDLFASRTLTGKPRPPIGNNFRRILQLLNSFVFRRPEDILGIPPLDEQTFGFTLDSVNASKSDSHFSKYQLIVNINSKDAVQSTNDPSNGSWKHLTLAMQYSMHPYLTLIMHLVRKAESHRAADDPASADQLYEARDIEDWGAWRDKLKLDDAWKSSRINAIIDVLNKCRDLDPECGVLIFEESVYFLDIVQVALESMYDPIQCLRFDGREAPDKRNNVLREFQMASGAKVLLISRAAGGVGLNITAANVVIICGPWWKREWEVQAIKRAHRPGQTRRVLAIRIGAKNCAIETYKAGVRDKKHRHNSKIVHQITRNDGEVPTVWTNLWA